MSFFSQKSEPTYSGNGATPLTQERIINIFKEKDWTYFIDNDGDFGTFFDERRFFFLLKGEQKELLYGRGDLPTKYDITQIDKIRDAIDSWHRRKLFPRVHHHIGDEGVVRITTEYTVDYEHGLTDEQLFNHIELLIDVTATFAEYLDEELGEKA